MQEHEIITREKVPSQYTNWQQLPKPKEIAWPYNSRLLSNLIFPAKQTNRKNKTWRRYSTVVSTITFPAEVKVTKSRPASQQLSQAFLKDSKSDANSRNPDQQQSRNDSQKYTIFTSNTQSSSAPDNTDHHSAWPNRNHRYFKRNN